MSEEQMSEKQETDFSKLEKYLRIMKINKLYDYCYKRKNAEVFYSLFRFCKFPETKTEKEKIEEIKNFIKNFWGNEVEPFFDEKYNEKTFLSLTSIKYCKSKNSLNNNPNPINNLKETNQNSVAISSIQPNQNTSQLIPFVQTFNPTPNNYPIFNQFMNYIPNQFGNIFEQSNNFFLNYHKICNKNSLI